jgi:hypothetical protein
MGKWFILQAAYCITGIGFFIRDMLAHVEMTKAMLNAFIWPYAQWLELKLYVLQGIDYLRALAH